MLKKLWLGVLGLLLTGLSHAFSPESGTWIFDSEENGKPGRGLNLDMQNGVLVATLYGYEQNGQPTFYTGVGSFDYDFLVEGVVRINVNLVRYVGGTSLSGGFRNAVADVNVGKAVFDFTHGTRGTVTLPGEYPKSISRFIFGVPDRTSDEMLGRWLFVTEHYSYQTKKYTHVTESFDFNSIKDIASQTGGTTRTAVSDDGRMHCENYVGFVFGAQNPRDGRTSRKFCKLLDAQGNILRSYFFTVGANVGQGNSYKTIQNYPYRTDEGVLHAYRLSGTRAIIGIQPDPLNLGQ